MSDIAPRLGQGVDGGYLSKRAARRKATAELLNSDGGWEQLIEAIRHGTDLVHLCIQWQIDSKMIREYAAQDEHRLKELEAAEDERIVFMGTNIHQASLLWLTADPVNLFKREVIISKDENGVETAREVTVMRDIIDIPRFARQAIQSIKVETGKDGLSVVKEIKLVDKTRAAEVLMKAAGIGKTVGQEVAGDFLDELTRRVAEARRRMIEESPRVRLTAESILASELSRFIGDPLGFAKFAWPWGKEGTPFVNMRGPCSCQRQFLTTLGEEIRARKFSGSNPVAPIRMAISSGHGIGKSFLAGMLVNYIMATRPGSQGTVTANTNTQLQTKTWPAIQTMLKYAMHRPMFSMTSELMFENKSRSSWYVSPQTCKEENSEAFAGQHAATATSFYINDEASAIPDKIFEVEDGGLTDGEPMQFMFGNPTKNSGKFFRVMFGNEGTRWKKVIIDSRNCEITNKVEIAQWCEDYGGEDSDRFRVRVRGLHPQTENSQFIELDRIRAAQIRAVHVLPDDPLICGLDAAWGGDDNNVFRFRRGLDARTIPPARIPGYESREPDVLIKAAARILTSTYNGKRVKVMFMDSAGIAAPVALRLRQMGHDNVIPINFGGHSPDKRYGNMRAWMYARARDWLAMGAIDKASVGADLLEDDLTSVGYYHDDKTRLFMEKKDNIKERTGRSPDDGDAFILTFAEDVQPDMVQQLHAPVIIQPRPGNWML